MKTNKLSIKAAISTIAGIAIIIVIIYMSYLSHKEFVKTFVSQTQNQLLSTLKVAAKGLDEFISYHQEALQILSNDPLIKERIYNKVQRKKDDHGEKFCQIENLYEAHKKHADALTIIDADGMMLDRDPFWEDNKNRIGCDYSDKPGIACVLIEHKPCVSEIFYNKLGNLALSISEPVFYKDEFAGIVRWMIETDTIAKRFIEPVKIGKNGFVWMFDNKNTVISHPRKDFTGITVLDVIKKMHKEIGEVFDESRTQAHIMGEHDYLNRVTAEDEGSGIFINCVTDEQEIIAYKRVAAGNLILNLIATLPYSEITGPINKHAREIFGLAGFIIIILSTGGLVVFRGQKQKARLEAEARFLKQIANGAEALRESERKFREFVEGTDDLVTRVDSNGTFTYVNDTSGKIFGLSPEECIGLSAFDFIHPDDREKTKAAFAEWVRERVPSITFENRQVSRSGKVHYMQWSINSKLDEDGNLIAIDSIARDFTELKLAEKRLKQYADTQEILIREVNHRVTNNLSAIIGMLGMEEEHAVEEGSTYYLSFLQNLTARIRGLSLVHGLLSASGWQPLKLSSLCEQILKSATQGALFPKNLEISITPSQVMVSSTHAHHLAMVINELATNSIKHGVTNHDNININIIIEQDGTKTTVKFKDNGPGFPEEIIKGDFSSANIGFELIQGIVTKSLGGNVIFENDNGSVTTISFENEINITTRRDTA
ncbi:MAG: PAS domain S-box protein [Proteobacteria bacterium]|nr:PAS domain S-box protein [Pseudomonadota bacterium]MCG2830996.1 PAS domain S-box protein [Desulfobacteraceae bacterium]